MAAIAPSVKIVSPKAVQLSVKSGLESLAKAKSTAENVIAANIIIEMASETAAELDNRSIRQIIFLIYEGAQNNISITARCAWLVMVLGESLDINFKDRPVKYNEMIKSYLLNVIQHDFERAWIFKLPMLEKERKCSLMKLHFVGELYVIGMINERLITECIRNILDFQDDPNDDVADGAVTLMMVTGKSLDASITGKPTMDFFFERIRVMVGMDKFSMQKRILLKGLVALRAAKWDCK